MINQKPPFSYANNQVSIQEENEGVKFPVGEANKGVGQYQPAELKQYNPEAIARYFR